MNETILKEYQKVYSQKVDTNLPVIINLDGSNFSKFTNNLKKPFDIRLSNIFDELLKFVVKETGAIIGRTHSDEISVVLLKTHENEQLYYNGKVNKINSKLASKVSVYFNHLIAKHLPFKSNDFPIFDCRTFNLPTNELVIEYFQFRHNDCIRNSIQDLFYHTLGHKKSLNKNSKEKIKILKENNIDYYSYPNRFRFGNYIKKRISTTKLTDIELSTLPVNHNAHKNPNLEFERTEYVSYVLDFNTLTDKKYFIFKNL